MTWYTPIISGLRRLRQEDCKFGDMWDTVSTAPLYSSLFQTPKLRGFSGNIKPLVEWGWVHSICRSLTEDCVLHPKPSVIVSHLWRHSPLCLFPTRVQRWTSGVLFASVLPPTFVLSWQLRKSWHSSYSHQQMLLAKRVLTPALLPMVLTLCSCFLFLPEQCDTHREWGEHGPRKHPSVCLWALWQLFNSQCVSPSVSTWLCD